MCVAIFFIECLVYERNKQMFMEAIKFTAVYFCKYGDMIKAQKIILFFLLQKLINNMIKTYESRLPPSPNFNKVTVSFDKLII